MRISVALCTYNGKPYLSEQVESILSQTYPPDEIVVFDDNSSDGTTEILDNYKRKYPDIFNLHFNDQTQGVVKNFERCIQTCNGDLIALSDQDDVWKEDKLEKQRLVFQKYNPALTFHNSTITDEQLEPMSDLWTEVAYTARRARQPETALVELTRRNMVQGATACFSSRLLPEITPIPSVWSHDYYIAIIAALLGRIYDLDDELLSYRQHEEQVIGAETHLFDKLAQGARTGATEYEDEARKWEIIQDKLKSFDRHKLTINPERANRLFQQRIDFERNRAIIRDPKLSVRLRFGLICRHLQDNQYAEYGNGYRSILKDIFALLRQFY